MQKLDFGKITKDVKGVLSRRSPEILTGIGIAGMVTSTILAVRATPKALNLIDEYEEFELDNERSATVTEKIKVAWKPYIPSVVTGVASAACLIGASKVNLKRNAALATAYKLSETALTEYKEKVIETIGDKKERLIRDKIAEEKIKNNKIKNTEVYHTGQGDTLFLEPLSGRYFKSNIDKIRRVETELNAAMLEDPYNGGASLNDFYQAIGLSTTDLGDILGWSIDKGRVKIEFSAQIIENDDGEEIPCIVLDYKIPPKYEYDR